MKNWKQRERNDQMNREKQSKRKIKKNEREKGEAIT